MSDWLSVTAIAFLLTSCSAPGKSPTQLATNFINTRTVVTTSQQTYSKKDPTHIALYTKDKTPHTAYRIIGSAVVSKYNLFGMARQEATIHDMMKQLAASIGGDGLINVNSNTNTTQANIIAFQKILI